MTDAVVSHLGQVNKTGDEWALFLKNYSGEVLTSFVESYQLEGRRSHRPC